MRQAITEVRNVPAISGNTPKLFGVYSGFHSVPNRNSVKGTSLKNVYDSTRRITTMIRVVRIERDADMARSHSIIFSPVFEFEEDFFFRFSSAIRSMFFTARAV